MSAWIHLTASREIIYARQAPSGEKYYNNRAIIKQIFFWKITFDDKINLAQLALFY